MADLYTSYATSVALRDAGAPQGDGSNHHWRVPGEFDVPPFAPWLGTYRSRTADVRAFRADEIIEALKPKLWKTRHYDDHCEIELAVPVMGMRIFEAATFVEALAASWLAEGGEVSEKVEKALTDAGVFLGQDGLEKFANADEFWDSQPYGTRLYFGQGTTDYLQRGVLRAAIETLATIPDLRAALAKARAESVRLNRELGAACELARRDLLAVAHAIGIVHEPDTGPCWPGPIEEIVRAIKEAKHEAREADSERARADRYLAAMRDAVRAYDRLAKGGYGGDLAVAWATLRALVEEARRG